MENGRPGQNTFWPSVVRTLFDWDNRFQFILLNHKFCVTFRKVCQILIEITVLKSK